jgi:glycosyltransferase involved in cell wall biosynthesis
VKIALLHYSYLPVIAGVELVMADHARLFAKAGHEVTVLADRPGAGAGGGIEVIGIPELNPRSLQMEAAQRALAGGAAGPVFEQAVTDLMIRLRPLLARQQVVMLHNVATMHFHLPLTAALWRLAEELTAVRFICWIHDLAACNPDYTPLPLDRFPWDLLAKVQPRYTYVAVSELRREQFLTLTGAPRNTCIGVPNGIAATALLDLPPQTAALERQAGLLPRDVVLLQPARLLRRKNIEFTLRVVAAIHATGRSCAALITAPPEIHHDGSGDYAREVRDLHGALSLERDVFFLHDRGAWSSVEVRGLYQVADALFFPSRQEGFGIPLLEAAVHRLPVFCSDLAVFRDLPMEGATTFHLDSDPTEVAAMIIQTLESNPAYRARKRTVRDFSWRAIYRNVLSRLLPREDTPPTL